jgi:peptide/nickel transport system permease protein
MRKYALRRLLIAVVVLFAISALDFAIINLAPGDPLQAILPPDQPGKGMLSYMYAQAGLNHSIPVRYLLWLIAVVHGNLGTSFDTGQPAAALIASVIPNTLVLTGSALVLALLLGVPLGVLSALKEGSWLDEVTTVGSFGLNSFPGFFLALLAVYVFSIILHWLPATGMYDYNKQGDVLNLGYHLVLPTAVLGILQVPVFVRYVRASLLGVLNHDYLRTARAKGLRKRTITWIHAMPNALSPLITIIGLSLPGLIGSSVLIEQVFAWPGLGSLSIHAAIYRDYPVFMGTALLYAVAVLVSNLLADLAYAFVDPRIRYD